MKIMNSCFIFFWIGSLLSCSNSKIVQQPNIMNADKEIYVYQILYSGYKYESVKGFAFVNGKTYFQPQDSLLMTYKKLSPKARLIENKDLSNLLSSFNSNNLSEIKDYNTCNCSAITKNEYIIRFIENGKTVNYVFSEVLSCPTSSPCRFLEEFHYYFEKYK